MRLTQFKAEEVTQGDAVFLLFAVSQIWKFDLAKPILFSSVISASGNVNGLLKGKI